MAVFSALERGLHDREREREREREAGRAWSHANTTGQGKKTSGRVEDFIYSLNFAWHGPFSVCTSRRAAKVIPIITIPFYFLLGRKEGRGIESRRQRRAHKSKGFARVSCQPRIQKHNPAGGHAECAARPNRRDSRIEPLVNPRRLLRAGEGDPQDCRRLRKHWKIRASVKPTTSYRAASVSSRRSVFLLKLVRTILE